MKILMLLSNPFITDPRVYNEATALVDAGNEVTVIVWDRRKEHKPEDVLDGVNIIRIHNNLLMKILPSDLFRNPLWWRKSYRKGLSLYNDGFTFDVVHCHDLDTLQAGVWLKKKTGCKLVYDAHEIFGYMILETMPRIVVSFTFWFEKRLIKNVDGIIAVSNPVKSYLNSITDKQITIVMNCKSLVSEIRQHLPNNSIFTVCYIGGFVESRMFPELVDIICSIDNVRFVVAGMKNGLYEEVKERCGKYKNCEFLGQISAADVIPKTLESDASICMFNPDRVMHQVGLPNKVFEAMVTKTPIIVTKDMYYSTNFVEKENCGLSVENSGAGVCKAITRLRDNPELCEELGKNGLDAAFKKYNWEKQKDELLEVYECIKESNLDYHKKSYADKIDVRQLKLNLGCGRETKEGYINVDMFNHEGVDLVWDLNVLPLPFKDNSVDEVFCSHILEHLVTPYPLVLDIHRILKPNGLFHSKLPTNCHSLVHLRSNHTSDYFAVVASDTKESSLETKSLFIKKSVHGNRRSIPRLISRFLMVLRSFLYDEYEYELIKREER